MESPRVDAEFEPMRTVVIKRHVATDSTQLELHVNDIVVVLEKDETGWWGGHKEGEDLTGWFPGFCVQALPEEQASFLLEKIGKDLTCSDQIIVKEEMGIDSEKTGPEQKKVAPRNAALETEVPSPLRRNHAVASPQRHGLSSGAPVTREGRCSEVLLQEKSRHCSLLDNEVAKLKQDKEALEEALRQAQKQNAMVQENNTQMVGRVSEVERRLHTESTERKATVLKCEQLEATLRHRDEEVDTLRRLSVASAMTPNVAALAQSPIQQTNDEGFRRRLFPSVPNGTTMSITSELSSTQMAANSSPDPIVSSGYPSGGCSAAVRTSSRSRGRCSEEEPPAGFVKQLRNAFEARSVTPQRPQSRGRGMRENAVLPGAWGISVTASAITGGSTSSQVPRQTVHGYCSAGLAISTEPLAEEIVYGMSPINAHSEKDLKKSASKAGRSN